MLLCVLSQTDKNYLTDVQMNRQIGRQMDERTDGQTERYADKRANTQVNSQIDNNRQKDGWADVRMERQRDIKSCFFHQERHIKLGVRVTNKQTIRQLDRRQTNK